MNLDDGLFSRIVHGFNPREMLADRPDLMSRCSDHSDMMQNLWILYALTVGLHAQDVLEIGTNDGTSTLAFLKAVHETGGRVYSIDTDDQPHAREIVERLRLAGQWSFERGDSHEVLPRLRAAGRQFDVIMVDGDHTMDGARRDVDACEALLRPNGILFTHDSFMMRVGDGPGCGYCVRDMLKSSVWQGVVVPFNCNLGVFQKRAPVFDKYDRDARRQPFAHLILGNPLE